MLSNVSRKCWNYCGINGISIIFHTLSILPIAGLSNIQWDVIISIGYLICIVMIVWDINGWLVINITKIHRCVYYWSISLVICNVSNGCVINIASYWSE